MELLPSYRELKSLYPLTLSQSSFIEESRETVRHILNGTDPRLLLIVGPCSIHDKASALEFALKLKELSQAVSSQFYLLMRVYCEKPRTLSGWKGFLYDPFLDGSNNIKVGIEWTRQLLLELAELQVPAATEFLDPLTALYYDDLIVWGSIGARTSSSQPHRQLASGLNMPIGFKNGVAGNISAAINGVLAASHPHTYVSLNEDGLPIIQKTNGNPDGHIVLRGGENQPNYDAVSIAEAVKRLQHLKLPLRLLVDCSHQNSAKKHDKQPAVFQSVLHQVIEGNSHIRGFMLESHLQGGNQLLSSNPSHLQYGTSITDSCLDWQSSSLLIERGYHQLKLHKWSHSMDTNQAPRPTYAEEPLLTN